ncbi:TPA: DNA polymerase type-Y, UV protection protein impB, partial [Escherichia coli]|nr:DNA polymerase type-Y, UV protection protein impB [Escherichia coli]EEX2624404.1 DNA polymerase type-Y, UV protection protein impB [Escherichia coli]HAJ1924632.1 DNA polymerase type-Y, UV protection protein impB [Escherichia coli]
FWSSAQGTGKELDRTHHGGGHCAYKNAG